jgi:hypothetical protein
MIAILPPPAALPDTRWRDLDSADASVVYDLHVAAVNQVGRPDLIRPETLEFFEDILSGKGRIFGTHDAQGLLAYGVLQWDLPPAEDLRPLLGLAPDAPFAKLAGAAVRPGEWGQGLQESSIARRVEAAAASGFAHLYATSAPGNWRSWTNLVSRGFSVRALIEQYGGSLRFILYRCLDDEGDSAGDGQKAEDIWCDANDVAAQKRCLDAHYVGMAWRSTGEERREICYRPPS